MARCMIEGRSLCVLGRSQSYSTVQCVKRSYLVGNRGLDLAFF
ncbi:hypothetical protein [Coleofasciculus sp. FACHB-712]|nr:hypothetical protein [Coleofasciculus sp. FACHB-712]